MKKNKKPVSTKLFLIMFALVLNSCSMQFISFGPFPTPTYSPKPIWLSNWLDSPTCRPPCWENIVPGMSNDDEVNSILKDTSHITTIEGPVIASQRGLEISWDFDTQDEMGVIYFDDQGVVYEILLDVGRYRILTVEDVIKVYGEPDSIKIFDCSHLEICFANLIYEELRMVLGISPFRTTETIEIVPSDQISSIVFFANGDDGYRKIYGQENIPEYPWQDFGIFDIPR